MGLGFRRWLALFSAVALVATFSAVLRGDDEQMHKQYVGRREAVDKKVATGFIQLAKDLARKKAPHRAKVLLDHVLTIGLPGQVKEAQALLDKLDQSSPDVAAPETEDDLDAAIKRYKKEYDTVVFFCDRRSLSLDEDEVKAHLAACLACSLKGIADDASPASTDPGKAGGGAGSASSGNLNDSQAMLERVNFYRKNASLASVALDTTLTIGCRAHCNYLVVNDGKPELAGLKAHEEVETLPGATPEGAKAGRSSDIAWGRDPSRSVDAWMASLFHRVPIMAPALQTIGGAHKDGTHFGHVSVLDVLSGVGSSVAQEVAYPPDGATGVPALFAGEMPDPIPAGESHNAGFPVTLTGYGESEYKACSAKLERDGAEVPCHFSSPEHPAADFPQQNTICMIPKAPLKSGPYKATFHYTLDGNAVTKVVSFTVQ